MGKESLTPDQIQSIEKEKRMSLQSIMDVVNSDQVMTPEWAREALAAIDAADNTERYRFVTEATRGMKFQYGDAYTHSHALNKGDVLDLFEYAIGKKYLHGTNTGPAGPRDARERLKRWLETGEIPPSYEEYIKERGLDKSYLSGKEYGEYLNYGEDYVRRFYYDINPGKTKK